MENSKQAEMEERVRAFLHSINTEAADTMCGRIQPRFVSCDSEAQTLTLSYPVQSWERNPIGRMQGGVIATLLDFSVAVLSACYTDMPVTVSLQVSYLRPGPLDGEMLVTVRCVHAGRTMIHAFASCASAAAPEKAIATANAVYMNGK